MYYNQDHRITINDARDSVLLHERIINIAAQLKWKRYKLERLNQKETNAHNRYASASHTTYIQLVIMASIFLSFASLIVIAVQTNSMTNGFIAMLAVVALTIASLMFYDKHQADTKKALKKERQKIKEDLLWLIPPDIEPFLGVALNRNDRTITLNDMVTIYTAVQHTFNLLNDLNTQYDAQTIFSINEADKQQFIQNATVYTTITVFEDTKGTICLVGTNKYSRHYYEYDHNKHQFNYLNDTIRFDKTFDKDEIKTNKPI